MLGGEKGHHVNQGVNTTPSTPRPGLCTSGDISLSMTSLSVGKISPDVQRLGSGVVGLVLTHWLTWCPFSPPSIDFYSEKNGPLWGFGSACAKSPEGSNNELLRSGEGSKGLRCPMKIEVTFYSPNNIDFKSGFSILLSWITPGQYH